MTWGLILKPAVSCYCQLWCHKHAVKHICDNFEGLNVCARPAPMAQIPSDEEQPLYRQQC